MNPAKDPNSQPKPGMAVRVAQKLIGLYRLLASPWLGGQCRFYPTCSCYAEEALARHGLLRGTGLSLWRLARCQPWCQGGLDPVPAPDGLRPAVEPLASKASAPSDFSQTIFSRVQR